jgi:hypothetical protein
MKASFPFLAEFFMENPNDRKIASVVLSRRWELLPT